MKTFIFIYIFFTLYLNNSFCQEKWEFVFDTKDFITYWEKYYAQYNDETIVSDKPHCSKIYIKTSDIQTDEENINIKKVFVKEVLNLECEHRGTFNNKLINYVVYELKILCNEHKYFLVEKVEYFYEDETSSIIELSHWSLDDSDKVDILYDGIYDKIYEKICK